MLEKRQRHVVLGWFLTAALVFSTARATAAHGGVDAAETEAAGPRRAAIFGRIAAAWAAGDASAFLSLFGSRKIMLSLPESGSPSGRFSRDQGYFILKNHFESTLTQEFRFVDTSEPGEARGMAVGLASRKYRARGDGRVVQDRVLVALTDEGGRWVVSQIQSLR